jgi:hypothetical protein
MEILGYRQKLQNAASTGTGVVLNTHGLCREHTFYITGTAGVTAGAVQPQTSPTSTGPWAPLGLEIAVSTTCQVVQQTGALRYIQCAISSAVANGTVTVVAEGN